MKKFIFLLIFYAFLLCSCATQQKTIPETSVSKIESIVHEKKKINTDNSLDSQLENLTNQIVESLSHESKSKIAVIEFSDLNGNITEFGMYLSEELITRLFLTRKFDVIERQLLNQVISEQKLGMTGLIDDESAIAIGKLLGVDAIVSGTITDLGISLKVNARLIATESGSVFAVAAAEILKDEKVKTLLNRMKETKPTVIKKKETEKPEKKPVENKTIVDKRIFFKEDFSEVEDGSFPKNWIGGETLMVTSDGRQKFLTPFEKSSNHNFIVSGIEFPNNFKFEWIINCGSRGHMHQWHLVKLGNVTIKIGDGYHSNEVIMNNTNKEYQCVAGKIIRVSFRKMGAICKLFIDDKEILMARYPQFKKPTGVSFEIHPTHFKLYKIIGTDLGE